MEYASVYFLTKDDENKEKKILKFFKKRNYEKKLNNKIQNLLDTKNLQIIKYKEYNEFIKKYNPIYYNGYTKNELNKPLRGTLYIRINKHYYVNAKEYAIKKWNFYGQLYIDILSPFGLKEIKNIRHNETNNENNAKVGFNIINANLDFNISNKNNENTNIEKNLTFDKADNLDIQICNFNNLTHKDQIVFLQNQIDNEDRRKIFSESIEEKFDLVKARTKDLLNSIHETIEIKNNNIKGIELSLQEKITTFNAGISFGYSNNNLNEEDIELNIIFYEYNKKETNIDKYLSPNVKLPNSNTSLIEAVWHQNYEAVKLLVEKGAKINAKQGDGITPLMFAVEKGNLEIAQFLIDNGADVNSRANNKNTPLITAAWFGQAECSELLIKNGANVNLKQCDGFTALHFASEKDFKEVAEVLIKGGADKNIKNLRNQTCVDLAKNHGDDGDVIQFFNSI